MKSTEPALQSRQRRSTKVLVAAVALLVLSNVAALLTMKLSGPWGQNYPANHPAPHGTELLVTYIVNKSTEIGQSTTWMYLIVAILVAVAIICAALVIAWKLISIAVTAATNLLFAVSRGVKNATSDKIHQVTSKKGQRSDFPPSGNFAQREP